MEQKVSFLKSSDGVRLAYATSGEGPPLVRAATWLTHLEQDWHGPVWGHWCRELSKQSQLIRYDERGCGLSERKLRDLSFDDWVADLESVVDHMELDRFDLFGMSQGGTVAIEYAARHPERVNKLILTGATPTNWNDPLAPKDIKTQWEALSNLAKVGWGEHGSAFVQPFAHMFIPEAEPQHIDWYADLSTKTASKDVAGLIFDVLGSMNVIETLPKLREHEIPTLIMQSERDAMVPLLAAQFVAAELPNAQFITLDSANHILLEDEPAFKVLLDAVDDFLHEGLPAMAPPDPKQFDSLTKRELEILGVMAKGLGNVEIGSKLFISEKTVRNHVTSILDKLGVQSRAKAIVLAKDMGL